MKIIFVLCLVVLSASACIASDGELFDKLNIQDIFDDDDKRRQAYDCLMDRTPCGKYQVLKDKCPGILKNDCANCSPRQKQKYQELMKKLEREHNDEYKEIVRKFKN